MQTKDGVTVAVDVGRDLQHHTVYTTKSGLIDGVSTQRRLADQLNRQFRETDVKVECPAVVAANDHQTFRCRATLHKGATHTVTVTVLDDRTGDYTYRLS